MKLTKRQLSLRFNVDDTTIYLWERNKVRPSLALIPKIIEFLGYNPHETIPGAFADKIKDYRRIRGISQKKLAHLVGLDPSTVSNWERGENQPSKRLLDKLNSFFNSFPSSSSRSEE